ncbi:MAG: glycerol kinase GlpK [Gammaproteobacteria bacterium]|nr:glycerol kinase GlpK [Gammaproteobacteria bacterium]MDH4311104.1 glycerol kinase GlpK [Gammaproteobacteria bacterium]MDH5273896.1 glycerol kinase GlpK [Gammaproteobacteria bacterium]
MPQFILALDQGTTSSRSILFDTAGAPVATAQREFTQHFPRSGWVEHDAEEIWATQAATITEVLVRARATPADVAAIGITNQRETTLLWDRRTGRPLAPAIVWQDRRTADLCRQLQAEGLEAEVARRTGLLLDPYFSGTKLAWLLDHVPGARGRAEDGELAFGTIDSWLVWKLSHGDRHVTDVSNASRTLLLNVASAEWDDFMLERLRIPRAVLPQVVPSSLTRNAPVATLGTHSIPIAGIAGDQQAALFGQACFEPGMAKNTYGTGCFLLMNTGTAPLASSNRLLTTIAWQTTDLRYALEGAVFIGGAVVQWLRDGLGIIERSADIEALAASVPDTGGVYLVPAFTGLGSPHWDAYARGTMAGLSRGTTRAHIARAALEAIAFQSAEVLLAMQRDARHPLIELRVDGGATANALLMQFQADLLGVPVVRPQVTETTALGAAYLAGLGTGFWSSPAEVAANWRAERRFEPRMSRDEANARLARWAQAVDRSRGWHVES